MPATYYAFDLLGFETPGAKLVHNLEYWYSFFSNGGPEVPRFL